MTIAQKIFWFFVVALVVNVGLSLAGYGSNEQPVQTVEEPVKKYGKEEQCKTSKWYVVYYEYDGKPIAKHTVQCFNNLVVREEKL